MWEAQIVAVPGGQSRCRRLAQEYLFPLKDMGAWLEVVMGTGSRRRQ